MDFPLMNPSRTTLGGNTGAGGFDMRSWLSPKRLTMVMWDYAFLTRHIAGDSFEDYDKVLDELQERGYNTIRLDPCPQIIDLEHPEKMIRHGGNIGRPFTPWDRVEPIEGPMGEWLIDFMTKVNERKLYYSLSAWETGFDGSQGARDLYEIAEQWKVMLRQWRKLFGFENCIYVDLSNEFPYFLGGHLDKTCQELGGRWSAQWNEYIRNEVNSVLADMREEFPEVRFTISLHGDKGWIDLDLELDCMDIHFYADADRRFDARTRFGKTASSMFESDKTYSDFSDRCAKSQKIMAPMFRACQRNKLKAFSEWSANAGIPLMTTESWASWFYIDHKELDWSWLLEWAEWSVEDAIEFNMWGWTPHNYCQPQFENWKDVKWHKRLTDRFLRS